MKMTIGERDAALESFMSWLSWHVYQDCDHDSKAAEMAQLLLRWMYDRGWVFVPRKEIDLTGAERSS